jgi:hypothetical protein
LFIHDGARDCAEGAVIEKCQLGIDEEIGTKICTEGLGRTIHTVRRDYRFVCRPGNIRDFLRQRENDIKASQKAFPNIFRPARCARSAAVD